MTLKEVHDYFYRNWSYAMRELGMSQNAYQYWIKKGYLPMDAQAKIEIATKGGLKASVHDLKPIRSDND